MELTFDTFFVVLFRAMNMDVEPFDSGGLGFEKGETKQVLFVISFPSSYY